MLGRAAFLLFCSMLAVAGARSAPAIEIDIDAERPGHEVNRLILGSNVQWVDRGDGILAPGGESFDLARLEQVKLLAPPTLRYPGGTQSDLYRWQAGVGPLALRRPGVHVFSRAEQPVLFGTDEFLLFCRQVGAEPLITVNMVTGDADEAAAWLAYVNGPKPRLFRGHELPGVRYWELGNEPYLIEERHRHLTLGPGEYVRRVNIVAKTLRRNDPSVKLGVALRSATLGGVAATPFPAFNRTVLAGLEEAPDFVAVHNAYAPYLMGQEHGETALFGALMAASQQVSEDLDLTQRELRRRWPDRQIGLALTEYAAFFDLAPPHDRRTASLAAALYTADLLRVLAMREDVIMAHHWSLIGNWLFGAIGLGGERRPVFEVFKTYGDLLRGRVLPARVNSPLIRTAQVGMVGPRSYAAATVLAVRDADTLVMFVLNLQAGSIVPVDIHPRTDETILRVSATGLSAPGPFSHDVRWASVGVDLRGKTATAMLSPHSLTIFRFDLSGASQ